MDNETKSQVSIAEMLRANDAELILRQHPFRAGVVFCWPYFRIYLVNVIWGIPQMFFVKNWTWLEAIKITAGCAGVGYGFGSLASLIYHVTPHVKRWRVTMALGFAMPAIPIPIFCAINDGPTILWAALSYHVFTIWFASIAIYWLASRLWCVTWE